MSSSNTGILDRPLVAENRKATKRSLRERNARMVFQQVLSGSAVSRADIARSTGLTRASVSSLVGDLIDRRLVRELGRGKAAPMGGKPPTLLEVDRAARQMICVDASADPVRAGLVDLGGTIIETRVATRQGLKGDAAVDAIRCLVRSLVREVSGSLLVVAVGSPGVVRPDGVVLQSANLGWANRDLAAELSGETDAPILVANDAQAAALAEFASTPDGSPSIVSVLIGAGIGAGIVLNGRLYRGETSSAGEIGHVRVGGAEPCTCGQVGCLETVASLPSLLRRSGITPDSVLRGRTHEWLLTRVSDSAWSDAASGLAAALSAVVAILDIGNIVLGGPIVAAGTNYLDLVRTELDSQVLSGRQLRPAVRYSTLGEDGVLLGVASYALNQQLGVSWTSQQSG